jgi:hydrogenase maturation factor
VFFSSDHPLFSEIFKTPESAANFISFSVLQLLFHIPSPTQEQREGVRSFIETVVPGSGREQANKIMDGAGTVFYSMERARRALGIMEPDANTLEKARRAFAEPQNNGG